MDPENKPLLAVEQALRTSLTPTVALELGWNTILGTGAFH